MEWNCIVVEIATDIFGANILSYYKLAIDFDAKSLIETKNSNVL